MLHERAPRDIKYDIRSFIYYSVMFGVFKDFWGILPFYFFGCERKINQSNFRCWA